VIQKRMLVIEDDIDLSEMLVTYFQTQGYEMIASLNGTDGIIKARAMLPNLILLDVMLPDMNGFDVCASLRTVALTRYIPIIFLTQRDERMDKVAGLSLGADDYLTKPFDVEELRLRAQGSLYRSTREQLYDPRTGLPAAPMVDEALNYARNQPGWAAFMLRINGLNDFRGYYGFIAADDALRNAALTLSEGLSHYGTAQDFVGMLAEEQFVVITRHTDPHELVMALCQTFASSAERLYNLSDRERGYLVVNDSDPVGSPQIVPLMSMQATPLDLYNG